MKNLKKMMVVLIAMLLFVTIPVSVSAKTNISKKSITITVGKKYQLAMMGTRGKVTWKTSNKKIATVSSKGLVTGKRAGKAVITAKVGKKSYKCKVKVKKKAPELKNLNASIKEIKCGESKNVIFTVKKEGSLGKIYLYDSKNKKIGVMHDDGKKGDRKKKDGIYTLSINISSKTAKALTYYARSGKIKSGKITVGIYSAPTANSKKKVEKAATKFSNIRKKYQTGNGTVSPQNKSKAISEATAYAKQLIKNGDAIYYEANTSSVTCKMSSGLTIVYQVDQKGYDSIGDNVSMKIVTMQPYRNSYEASYETYMQKADDAARAIATEFNNYSFSENLDESAVSLEKIKNIGANQVIIWHGHGGYDKKNHSFLCTGEKFDWNKWLYDVGYWWDCVQDRIIQSSDGRTIITSKFINKYCKNMNNSLIYLAACQSGKDNTLASAFLNKGAKAVIANSETIYTKYNLTMENAVLTNMTKINSTTKNYYTLSEALALAKQTYGNNDGSANHAYPIIFGGSNANNYRFGEAKQGKLEGKVASAENRSLPIANAKIVIGQNGKTIQTIKADRNGNYSVSLLPGKYLLKISAEGYLTFSCYAEVESGRIKYMESFLMIDGQKTDKGKLYGYISHATTGSNVSGVKIQVRKDWNNPSIGSIVGTTITNANGYYELENLPIGHYTVTISKNGYVTTNFNVIVQRSNRYAQNATIAEQSQSDTYQIVLTWSADPRDLDSHMTGTLPSGETFHTYFRNKNCYYNNKHVCKLDVDDVNGYGPETITVQVNNTAPYYYYVYKYSGRGSLSSSGAQVKVYKSGKLLATYNVPTNQGTNDYWNVFSIVNGKIITKNTITSSADIGYATLNKQVSRAAKADLYLNASDAYNTEATLEGMEKK